MKSLGVRIAEVCVVVFLVAILVAEVLIYAPGLSPVATLGTSLTVEGPVVSVSDLIQSSYPMSIIQTLYLVSPANHIHHIYYYYDSAYPSSFSSTPNWYGLSQHLQTISDARQLGAIITVIDAAQLAQFVSVPPVNSTVLVVASGVLPDSVFTKTLNTLAPWIRMGGLTVWVGDTIGYYSGVANQPLTFPSPANPGNNGTAQFVNLSLFGGKATLYGSGSPASTGFGVNYPYGLGRDGLNLSRLRAAGGVAVGPTSNGYTNIATLTFGLGRLIYFSAPVSDVNSLSLAIWNLFESSVAQSNFVLDTQFNIEVSTGEHKTVSFQYPLPLNVLGPSALVCSFAYDSGFIGDFANQTCIPLGS